MEERKYSTFLGMKFFVDVFFFVLIVFEVHAWISVLYVASGDDGDFACQNADLRVHLEFIWAFST